MSDKKQKPGRIPPAIGGLHPHGSGHLPSAGTIMPQIAAKRKSNRSQKHGQFSQLRYYFDAILSATTDYTFTLVATCRALTKSCCITGQSAKTQDGDGGDARTVYTPRFGAVVRVDKQIVNRFVDSGVDLPFLWRALLPPQVPPAEQGAGFSAALTLQGGQRNGEASCPTRRKVRHSEQL